MRFGGRRGVDDICLFIHRSCIQLGNILRRMLQVLIQGNHPIAGAVQDTRHGGGMLAKVTRQGNQPQPVVTLLCFQQNIARAIVRTVYHEYGF